MPKANSSAVPVFMAGGQSIPLTGFVQTNPRIAAATSKVVRPVEGFTDAVFGEKGSNINPVQLSDVAYKTASKIQDAETVKAMLPDIQMALDILVASIISPNDMMKSETTFTSETATVGLKANESMLAAVRDYFDKEYPIASYYAPWLQEILGRSGAKVLLVLPESTIDDIINSDLRISVESEQFHHALPFMPDGTFKSLGFLGEANQNHKPNARMAMEALRLDQHEEVKPLSSISLESFAKSHESFGTLAKESIQVSDNFDILKMPDLHESMRVRKRDQILKKRRVSLESSKSVNDTAAFQEQLAKLSPDRVRSLIYRQRKYERKPVVVVKSQNQLNRRTIGSPTIMEINTEAFIPIHAPGKKENLLGGFVLLDMFGYPINFQDGVNVYDSIMSGLPGSSANGAGGGAPTSVMGGTGNYAMQQNAMNSYFSQGTRSCDRETFALKTREYARLVEDALVQKLKNGIYPDGVEFDHLEEVARVMLARSLQHQQTTMLFVPRELVTYMAFDYDANGIGKSLLDSSRIVNSQRIQISLANQLASIKNSIGLTDINVKLDEDTIDVRKAMMQVTDAVMAGKANQIPTGMIDPPLISYWIQRQGIRFSWEGSQALPDVKIDYNEVNTSYVTPDTELEEVLVKRSHQSLKVPTELIDAAQSPDFASVAAKNSIMFSKNVQLYQDRWTPQLTQHVHQVIHADQPLYDQLRDILIEHYQYLEPEFTEEEVLIGQQFSKEQLRNFVIDKVLHDWIADLKVTLPSPDNTILSNQLETLNEMSDILDKVLESYISDEIFNSNLIGDGMSAYISTIVAVYKASAMRQFIAQQNILPEIQELFGLTKENEDNTSLLPQVSQFIDAHLPKFMKFLAERQIVARATETAMEKANISEGEDTGGGSDMGSDEDTGGDSGGDDFGMGDLDFPEVGEEESETEAETETTETTSETTTTTSGGDAAADAGGGAAAPTP